MNRFAHPAELTGQVSSYGEVCIYTRQTTTQGKKPAEMHQWLKQVSNL
jgi:hypothetical protein